MNKELAHLWVKPRLQVNMLNCLKHIFILMTLKILLFLCLVVIQNKNHSCFSECCKGEVWPSTSLLTPQQLGKGEIIGPLASNVTMSNLAAQPSPSSSSTLSASKVSLLFHGKPNKIRMPTLNRITVKNKT